ncbi:Alanine-tRNA ligase, class IIc [Cynara cardunculus var. scolymus]|uniref:Alanine--tRNA ligase n=1 Tax=Cynara cardunculus var. scolymus TaxID=59895 RepID=A0A103Y7Q5_CYNCS|nr:Alanine-tRNA ligase, class IIc [Cynara cardunculus var. scolymus]
MLTIQNLHAGFRNYRDFIVQSLSLIYPTRLPSRNSRIKRRDLHFIRNASASVQPLTEDLVEETSQDLPMSGNSIRRRFLEFYAARGHKILPSSSLVPDDPTVLLTIAGMLQFKPVFLGKVPRQVPCATTSQKCIRTNDIENVGRTSRHHTFFEMLGNFSFGDYFKKEAIKWAWELSTIEYGLTAENLWISVYEHDEETYAIWHDEVKRVPANRIKKMGEEDNFWTSGLTGPCGPCSEIYYDFHPNRGHSDAVPNNYETDLIFPIIEKVSELANVSYALTDDSSRTKLKVIGDHMRAIVYLISDGVFPSNIGRGYVVRRLIRRAVRTGRLLGIRGDEKGNIEGAFLPIVAEKVIDLSSEIDPDVKTRKARILEELKREELRFVVTLERGEKLLDEMLDEALENAKLNKTAPCLSGKIAFLLYDTYGFPVEITMEEADERGVSIDMSDFDAEMEIQRRQSQAAHNTVKLMVENGSELTENVPDTEFLGYDTLYSKAVIKGLLLSGKPVVEVSKGSEVEVLLDRTPFYAESGGQIGDRGLLKVTETESRKTAVVEIADVQKSLGNIYVHKGMIKEGTITVGREVEAAVDAKLRQRAKVRVVNVPGVSMELCGGTHVSNTSEIRGFKIISEQGIASGIRRIEAVAGDAFIEYVSDRDNYMKQLCSTLKVISVKAEEVPSRVAAVMEELRMAKNEVSAARAKTAVYKASVIANNVFHVGTSTQIRVLVEFMDDTDADSLKSAAEYLVDALGDPSAIILGSSPGEEKVSLVAAFSPSVVSMGIQAGKFIGPIAKMCGGGGGGRANFAQAGGRKPENLSSALEKARTDLVSALSEKAS